MSNKKLNKYIREYFQAYYIYFDFNNKYLHKDLTLDKYVCKNEHDTYEKNKENYTGIFETYEDALNTLNSYIKLYPEEFI